MGRSILKHSCRGYFTIEATLVVPVILFVMLWIVYVGCYQYNRCFLTQELYKIVIDESANSYLSNQEIKTNILERIGLIDWDKAIAIEIEEINVESDNNKIIIKIKALINLPIQNPFIASDHYKMDIMIIYNQINPLKVLRRIYILKEL